VLILKEDESNFSDYFDIVFKLFCIGQPPVIFRPVAFWFRMVEVSPKNGTSSQGGIYENAQVRNREGKCPAERKSHSASFKPLKPGGRISITLTKSICLGMSQCRMKDLACFFMVTYRLNQNTLRILIFFDWRT